MAELFRSTFAQAGAYRRSADSLLATPEIAIDPSVQEVQIPVPFRLNKGELELEIGGRAWTLEKVD